jgi:membrane-associated phospholipid phosphatase
MRLCDRAAVAYCGLVAFVCIVRASAVPFWWAFSAAHVAIAAGVIALSRRERTGWFAFVRTWDAIVYVPLLFVMAMRIVHAVNPNDWDETLARWDDAIGGLALLRSMVAIERPWLTDAMKLAWVSYYFLPLLVAIPLVRTGDFLEPKDALVSAWLVTFAFYFAMPAMGPGWFEKELNLPQPNWKETRFAGSAKAGIDALERPHTRETFRPRHAFPSGHVMVAAMASWYLLRHRRWRWAAVAVPLSVLMVCSTLYLRYHYVVDVIGGFALAAAFVVISSWSSPTTPS